MIKFILKDNNNYKSIHVITLNEDEKIILVNQAINN